jgi:hypothetical protein
MLHYIPCTSTAILKFSKLFAPLIAPINLQHIEPHRLTQRSTLSNSNNIALLNTETWRDMSSKILVTFLIPIIFLHIMKIITTIVRSEHWFGIPNDDCTMHFSRDDNTRENSTTNRDLTRKGTFLVYTVKTILRGVYQCMFPRWLLWEF